MYSLFALKNMRAYCSRLLVILFVCFPAILLNAQSNKQRTIPIAESVLKYCATRQVIGMGEATHGSHEFETIKSDVFKLLVAQKHFSVFALEANFTECLPIDSFIKTGIGDPRKLVSNMMLWPWKTGEMLGLIDWMRKYNL